MPCQPDIQAEDPQDYLILEVRARKRDEQWLSDWRSEIFQHGEHKLGTLNNHIWERQCNSGLKLYRALEA